MRRCPQSIVLLAYEKAGDVRALIEQVKARRYAMECARDAEMQYPVRDVRDALRKAGGDTAIAATLLGESQVRTRLIATAMNIKCRNSRNVFYNVTLDNAVNVVRSWAALSHTQPEQLENMIIFYPCADLGS